MSTGNCPSQLPAGRHGLPRSFVVSNQRERMLAAVADTVFDRGYAGLTVGEVARRARVSRRTFYDQFADKREALFAAYDASVAQVMLACAQAFAGAERWPLQVRLAVEAFLSYLCNDPAFTRIGIVEIRMAGPEGESRHMAGRDGFEVFLQGGEALAARPVSPLLAKAIGSGIFAMLHSRVVSGRAHELAGLAPACVYHCLAPYLGIQAARREAALVPPVIATAYPDKP